MKTTEQRNEAVKVLDSMENKLNGIDTLSGAIIDLCHHYREAEFINQEFAFTHIIEMVERCKADAGAVLDALESMQEAAGSVRGSCPQSPKAERLESGETRTTHE